MPSTKELVEELKKYKAEVAGLRNSLNALDNEKESWFKKKRRSSQRENKERAEINDRGLACIPKILERMIIY